MRAISNVIKSLTLLVLFSAMAAGAVTADAAETAGITCHLDGANVASVIDDNYYSKLTLGAGQTLHISSPQRIEAVYAVWDSDPGMWSLTDGQYTYMCGQNGYIHEVVMTEGGAQELDLTVGGSAVICDIYCFADTSLPDWVQVWQPQAENADLLLMPTHADDELLMFGGTLPYYAGQLGLDVQVAYLTNHNGEQPRPHEQLNALWDAGVRRYPLIGPFNDKYSDSLSHASGLYGYENVLEYQVSVIRRFKPLVVVGHDFDGEYGHGAHMLNAATLADAVKIAGDAAACPASASEYGTWQPHKVYFHRYAPNGITIDWDVPLSAFGGKTALEVCDRSLQFHRSQLQYVSMEWAADYDYDEFGLFYTLVGPDVVGGDFFENVTLTGTEQQSQPSASEAQSSSSSASSSAAPSQQSESASSSAAEDARQTVAREQHILLYCLIGCITAAVVCAVLLILRRRSKKNGTEE